MKPRPTLTHTTSRWKHSLVATTIVTITVTPIVLAAIFQLLNFF